LLKENEQLKQQVEALKIQLGKEKQNAVFQATQASYRAKVAELQRARCDSLLKVINKKH
jgi:cell division septum initiation protein DivIVA